MPQFYTLLTDTGQAKLANAVALGGTIEITELAVGDGGGSLPTPDSSATALINEVRRAAINTSQTDPDNPSWIVVEQVLPPDVGGWTIREIGIYDVDGDLIGIGNYPETYKPVLAEGSSRTQTVRFVLEVSDTAAVTLKVDPSVVLATREYVDDQRAAHEASRAHPLATTDERGMIEKATLDESLSAAADKFPDASLVAAFVRQYGLGAYDLPRVTDANDIGIRPGFYEYNSSGGSTNGPYDFGTLIVVGDPQNASGGDWAIQLFAGTDKNLYLRNNLPTGWRPWTKLLTDENTLEATTDKKGLVEKATLDEAKTGAAGKYPDAGLVLKVMKQFGLGVTGSDPTLVPGGNLDDPDIPAGISYRIDDSVTGSRPFNNGGLFVSNIGSGKSNQLAFDYDSNTIYIRHYNGTTWGSWLMVYTSGNMPSADTDKKGIVEKATSAEMEGGAVDKFPDAATLVSYMTKGSMGDNGYRELPGGLILQWGRATVTGPDSVNSVDPSSSVDHTHKKAVYTLSFPVQFPTGVFFATPMPGIGGSTEAGELVPSLNGWSLNDFAFYLHRISGANTTGESVQVCYFALGY